MWVLDSWQVGSRVPVGCIHMGSAGGGGSIQGLTWGPGQ